LFDNAGALMRQGWQKLNAKNEDDLKLARANPDITLAATQVIDASVLDNFSNRKSWKIIGALTLMGLIFLLGYEFAHQPASPAKRQDLFGTDNKKSSLPLRLSLEPGEAQVRLLNIDSRYLPGMELPAGYYQLEISAPGYNTKREWVHLSSLNQSLSFQLDRKDIKRDFIEPDMVEIPAGSLAIGDTTVNQMKKLATEKAFYIGKYEVTFAEYDAFAKATNRQLPDDNGWGRGDRPAINLSWNDAQAYAEWLSDITGKTYRLPTSVEWEFAARAKTPGNYWWGSTADKASEFANCQKGCRPWWQTFFHNKTKAVGSYPPNDFGLHDTAGNAAEWVADCVNKSESNSCEQRLLRGGAFSDSVENIGNLTQVPLKPDSSNATTGTRLVRDIPAPKKAEPISTTQPAQNPVQRFFHRIFK
jgi:serine/threonine-protein kinase PpkA